MSDPQPHDETSWTDEIVAEARSAREQLLADAGNDLQKLADGVCRRQEASGRAAVTFQRRAPAKEASA